MTIINWTRREALAAVKRNGTALNYLPYKFITPEVCLVAVKQNGFALKYIPEEHRTPEVCLEAVKENEWALIFVPDELKTPEMCLAAVKEEEFKEDEFALEYVPNEFQNGTGVLSEEEILAKYTIEEMLTSKNSWMRLKGRELNEHL